MQGHLAAGDRSVPHADCGAGKTVGTVHSTASVGIRTGLGAQGPLSTVRLKVGLQSFPSPLDQGGEQPHPRQRDIFAMSIFSS